MNRCVNIAYFVNTFVISGERFVAVIFVPIVFSNNYVFLVYLMQHRVCHINVSHQSVI